MADKIKINPQLIAAVHHYAEGRFDWNKPSLFAFTDSNGKSYPWPLERTCGVAAEILGNEELAYFELMQLKEGLKKYKGEFLYERITGRKLDA